MHMRVTADAQQVGRVRGGDHARLRIFQAAQRRQIEVIHVRVRKKNEIDGREILVRQSDIDQAFDADGERSQADAHAGAEDRVGEYGEPIDFQ